MHNKHTSLGEKTRHVSKQVFWITLATPPGNDITLGCLFEVFELPVGGADLAVHRVDLIEQSIQRNVLVVDLGLQP